VKADENCKPKQEKNPFNPVYPLLISSFLFLKSPKSL